MNTHDTMLVISALLWVALLAASIWVLNNRDHWRSLARMKEYTVEAALQSESNTREESARLRENNLGLAEQLNALRSARNVSWTAPAKRPSKLEIKRAFAVDDGAPLWVALNCELDSFLQDLFDQVSLPPGPSMNEEARTHLAGGIEEVRKFQKRLLDLHAAAQKVDADLEGGAADKNGGES